MTSTSPSSRRAGRPRKGDRREEAILRVTEELLASVSLERLTVEAIATGAGISRASLYFYFASKEDVVVALARRRMEVLARDARAALARPDEAPLTTIRRSVGRAERLWADHGTVLRLVWRHAASVTALGELWAAAMQLEIEAADRVLRRAGLPSRGAGSARSVAEVLCHMTADAFARVPPTSEVEPDLHRTAATVLLVWRRVIDAADGSRP